MGESYYINQTRSIITTCPTYSFIHSHYPRVQLPAASHYILILLLLSFVLPSLLPLSACFLLSLLVQHILTPYMYFNVALTSDQSF